ncbi:TonB-dependent receptor domain-containing protein [Stutzerimonas kirkiae]|nr:TonB-dependent receptor [Stutzerimonas kirkiae]
MRHTRPSPRMHRLAIGIRFGLALLTGSYLGMTPMVAHAERQVHDFDIPAQPLNNAMLLFAEQSGLEIVLDNPDIGRHFSQRLSGRYSVESGLQHLLQDSGIGYQLLGDRENLRIRLVTAAPPGQEDGALQIQTISISGSDDSGQSSIYTTPKAVFQVDRERLERVPYSSPGDILKGIPGVMVGNARNGVGIEPNVRGMQGMGRVKVLVDGTEAVSSAYKGYGGNKDNSFVDPDFLAAIDVEKGPSSTSGAIGGTIRMRTLGVQDLLTDTDKNWGIQLKGMYGNNTSDDLERFNYCNVSATSNPNAVNSLRYNACINNTTYTYDWNGTPYVYDDRRTHETGRYPDINASGSIIGAWQPFDNLELVAGHSHRWSGNYAAGERGRATYVNYQQNTTLGLSAKQPGDDILSHQDTETILFKSKLHLPADQKLEFTYNHYRSIFGELRDTAYCTTVGNIGDCFPQPSETNQKRYSLSHGWQPGNPLLNLKTDFWYVNTDELRGSNDQQNNVKTLGLRMGNDSHIALPWFTLNASYGGQWSREKTDSAASDSAFGGSGDPGSSSYAGRGDPLGETHQHALFTELKLPVNTWLTLHGGLRYDHFKMEKSGSDVRHANYSSPVTDDKESHVSLSYGLTLEPWQGVQVYARYSEGFRAPSMRESLLRSVDNSPEGLKPETSENVELGVNLAFNGLLADGDRLGAKLSWFDNQYDNYIYGNGYLPGFANLPELSLRGQELALNYDAGWLFAEYALTHYEKVEACYRQLNGLNAPVVCRDGAGAGMPGDYSPLVMPRASQFLTTGVRLFDRALVLGINVNKVSDPIMTSDPMRYRSLIGWAGYTVYDLFASYAVNKNLQLGLSVENLRDTYYLEAGTTSINLPSPGRTARGTITVKF